MTRPSGWERVHLPVLDGPRPDGVVTLAALAGRVGFADAVRRVHDIEPRSRAAAMTVLHRALAAVSVAMIAPLAVDGVALAVAPDAVGVLVGADGTLEAVWVGRHRRPELLRPAAFVGAQAKRMLEGVAAQAGEATGLHGRGLMQVMAQSLEAACRTLAGTRPGMPAPGWYEELRVAAGLPRIRWRRLVVQPDAGPPVVQDAPATCCVLSPGAGGSSCPACPQHPRAQQAGILAAWLAELDDRDFRAAVGRDRVLTPSRAA